MFYSSSPVITHAPGAVLTLLDFTQAPRVAEGADRPRLPAAPALHHTPPPPPPPPRLPSPLPLPRPNSFRTQCRDARCRYIMPAEGGGRTAGSRRRRRSRRRHVHAPPQREVAAMIGWSSQLAPLAARRSRMARTQRPAHKHTGPQCIAAAAAPPPLLTPTYPKPHTYSQQGRI